MSVQYDGTLRTGNDNTNVAVTLGTASLGGTIGVRVTVDDAVVTSKEQAMVLLQSIENILLKQTWPAT